MKPLLFLPAILILILWWIYPDNKKETIFTAFNQKIYLTVAIGGLTISRFEGQQPFSKPTFHNDYFLDPSEFPESFKVPIYVNLIGTAYPQVYGDDESFNIVAPLWIIFAVTLIVPIVYLKRRS